MKRIANLCLAILLCAVCASAQSSLKINFTPLNEPIPTGSDNIVLIEDEIYTEGFVNGEDSKKMGFDVASNKGYVYTMIDGNICSIKSTNSLPGTFLVVKTNAVTTYKFEVAKKVGKTFTLIDHELHTTTPLIEGMSYPFTAAANTTISDRFEIGIYTPGEFKVCTTFDHVEIYENQGSDNIVITNAAGETVVDVAPVPVFQSIDLSGKPAGHYFLTVNGETYEFCNKPQAK